jgi:iron complex outermembrane receptor protein
MNRALFTLTLLSSVSYAGLLAAQEAYQLPTVDVTDKSGEQRGFVSPSPFPAPVSSVTREGIAILGGPGQVSSYQPLDLIPSVSVESPDPYGLSNTRNINIRGKGDFHLSKNIEGLPIGGIVGGTDLYDLENIGRIDLYRSAMPANVGLGISNATGVIDQRILAPQDKPGLFARQGFGTDNFYKTFLRVDTGVLPETGTRAFISGSVAGADKWKGDGEQTRKNLAFGVSQNIGEKLTVDVNAVYNNYFGNTYRALTYAQTLNLAKNYRYDYNTVLTGNPATDVNYYKFNRLEAETYATFAKFDYALTDNHHIIFKPYYWNNDGKQYSAAGNQVQIWRQQNDNLGGVLEYNGRLTPTTDAVLGYWWQSMSPPPPPTDQRRFTVTPGGGLAFANWQTLSKINNFTVNSPFAQLSHSFGSTYLTAGARYMSLGAPKMQYYATAGLPDSSYQNIWNYNPALLADGTVAARDYNEWLPNVGLRHDFNAAWSFNASYGRRFGRPDWGPQASNYIANRAAFQSHGINLQNLVDGVQPEVADQFDVSLRYNFAGLTVVPTAFYSKHQNKQIKIVDPSIGPNIAYYVGAGSTTEYGGELEVAYEMSRTLSLFASATLASETFDTDTPTLTGGASLATKGKQIPNTPQVMLKGAATYRWNQFAVTPIVRYIGPRFGDAQNVERVPGYAVADLIASYEIGPRFGFSSITASLSILNIFDKQYVAQISSNETDLSSGATYYVGAPRTIAGSLSVKF